MAALICSYSLLLRSW